MLYEAVDYLDDYLGNDEWSGIDASMNGLQVESSGELDKVVFAVDAAQQTIREAVERDADLLVVHHGIIWGGIDQVTGQIRDRIKILMENDMALYASHLPLDAHSEVGNNVLLLDELDAEPQEKFGDFGGKKLGYVGSLPQTRRLDEVINEIETRLSYDATTLRFGEDHIQDIAVVTGSGADTLPEAAELDADLFVSGEPKHKTHHDAREHGINAVFAGHYQTETFGVKSLQTLVESRFGIETEFVDVPTEI